MKVYRSREANWVEDSLGNWYAIRDFSWDELVNRRELHSYLVEHIATLPAMADPMLTWLAPLVRQEVWAAGVTYLRSKVARMEESQDAGGGDFYDRVYDAERPEIFFKATPERTVGPGEVVHIRRDSSWNVPEPELTLFCCSEGSIEGYTVGNDMSSRSIEGENPLYLPQAKSYNRSAALGPCLFVPKLPISLETVIRMQILRGEVLLYEDEVAISQMKRSLEELTTYLFRECTFVHGVFLMTGTCLVPPDDFTLAVNDRIKIEIDGIGILENTVGIAASK
ncbi:MAG: fumarylacetoacetate hydrolase family protein [Saprospiraceae bacterium]|nr:fumarylacetoacetate hydrolase family protein [Saprospiraceae bacterium]